MAGSRAAPTHDAASTTPADPQSSPPQARRRPLPRNHALLHVQRKCSCGGAGECDACAERNRLGVQPKVAVGPVDDPFEREADDVAASVVAGGAAAPPRAPDISPRLQREVDDDEDVDTDARGLQRRASGPAPAAANLAPGTLTHGGSPLPAPLRAEFERRFGRDFAAVRIHSGEDAERATRDVTALAFTFGSHIWLGRGQRVGFTTLLAHELTHVVQQTSPPPLSGPAPATKPVPSEPPRLLEDDEPALQSHRIQRLPGDATIQRCPPQPADSESLTLASRLSIDSKPGQGILRINWCDAVGNEVVWVQFSWEPRDDRQGPAFQLDVTPGDPTKVTLTAEAPHRVDVVIDTLTEQALTSVKDEVVQVRHIYKFPGGVTRAFGDGEFERTEAPVEIGYEYYPPIGEGGPPNPAKLAPTITLTPPPKPKWQPKVWTFDTQEKFDAFAASHKDTKWADVLLPDGKHVAYALTVESITRMADKVRIADVNFEFLSYYPGGKVVAVWLHGEQLPRVEDLRELYYRDATAALTGVVGNTLETEVFQMEGRKFGRVDLSHEAALLRWNDLASLPSEDLASLETQPGRPFHALKIRGASGLQFIYAPELQQKVQELEDAQEFGAADPLGDDLTKPLPADLSMADIVSQLKTLYRRKQNAIENREPIDEVDALDDRIGQLIDRLRLLGVRRDENALFNAIQAGIALDKVTGRLVVTPPAPWFMGQRFTANVLLDYVPPGSSVDIRWRWSAKGPEYPFASHPDGSSLFSLTPDGLFWNVARDNDIGKANGVEITADVHLDGRASAETRLTTGWMELTGTLPERVSIETPRTFVVGTWIHAKIAEFVPTWDEYSVDWYIDGQRVVTDVPSCDKKLNTTGTFKLSARVYRRVDHDLDTRQLLFEPTVEITVQNLQEAAESALAELAKQKLPSLVETGASIEASIKELGGREAQGGLQADYWRMRREGQEKRLAALERLSPEWRSTQTLPGDPAAALGGQAYAVPIPAAVVVPGDKQQLLLYLTAKKEGDVWKARLLDVTGADVWKFDGEGREALEAIHNAFVDWKDDHPYPYGGRVVYSYNPPGWTLESSFSTTRVGNVAKAWVDGLLFAGMVVAGILLLAAPEATITKVVGVMLITATIARSTYQIVENIDLGIAPLDSRNILEGLVIVTSVTGLSGSVLRQVGLRAARPVAYRVGNWLVLATVTADAATLVYATDAAWDTVKAIQSDPTRDDSQKVLDVARIMTTLMAQGLMFIIANKDMVSGKTGLRRSDFFATDPKATLASARGAKAPITLEPGARLDVAAELRKAGDLVQPLATMEGGELLTRYSLLPWAQEGVPRETTADLLQRLSTDSLQGLSDLSAARAKGVADKLGDDVVLNALAPLLKGTQLSNLVDAVGRTKVQDLHGVFGADGVGKLVADLELGRLAQLVGGKGGVSAAELQAMSTKFGNDVLKNLASDPVGGLTGQEIKQLATTHGDPAVKWAGTDLPGKETQALLSPLKPDAITGLQDVSAKTAQALVGVYGTDTVNRVAPTVGGERLDTIRTLLGDPAAKDIGNKGKVANLKDIGDRLVAMKTIIDTATPLGAGSVAADSNALIALDKLMNQGLKWAALEDLHRASINALRARSALPPLTTDPPALDLASIVGTPDIRGARIVLGEVGPVPGLKVSAFELTVSRNSPEYKGVLAELSVKPEIGGPQGAPDRAAVADAAFAKTSTGKPAEFQTADAPVFNRLARYGPAGLTDPPAGVPGAGSMPVEDRIRINLGGRVGFVARIPDGLGGFHEVFVIPVFK